MTAMEPPPDTSWLQVESVRAKPDPFGEWATGYTPQPPETAHGPGWVHRAATTPERHECAPPSEADAGDLWRCWCGHLWCVAEARWNEGGNFMSWEDARWVRASLRQRFRWWGTPGRPEPRPKPCHPPAGESGVSRGPDGAR